MNQIGQVAEAGRPKLTVSRYRAQYRGRVITIERNESGRWLGWCDDVMPVVRVFTTPEAALDAAVAWVDVQEGKS